MIIESLHLTSFKGFKDFELECSQFTVLVGPNSGGKTSVLEAIQLLLDFVVFTFGGKADPDFSNPRWQTNPQTVLGRLAVGDEDAIWLDKKTSEACKLSARLAGNTEVVLSLTGRSQYELDIRRDGNTIRDEMAEGENRRLVKQLFGLRANYVPAIGTIPPTEQWLPYPQYQSEVDRGRASANWRLGLYWLYNDGQKDEYEKVTELVEHYLPGCRVQAPRQTHENPAQVMITFEEAGTAFSITTGGGGLQTLLNIAGVLHFSQSRCFLFDEPDAHLHGTLQRDVAQMLQEYAADNDAQIFVATHSPDFISEIPIESLVWINRQQGSARKCESLGEYLVNLGSISKADAIRSCGADKVLFLEGALDWGVLRRFWCNSGMERNPFTDSSVIRGKLPDGKGGATHLAAIQEVLLNTFGLNTKLAALTDLDYDLPLAAGDGGETSGTPPVLSLPRKEVENYLISSELLAAAVQEANEQSRKPREKLPTAEEIQGIIDDVLNTQRIRDQVKHQLVPAYRETLEKGWDVTRKEAEGDRWFDTNWANRGWQICHCPGKEVLKEIRRRLQETYGITVTTPRLIRKLETFPEDLSVIAAQLDAYFYGE